MGSAWQPRCRSAPWGSAQRTHEERPCGLGRQSLLKKGHGLTQRGPRRSIEPASDQGARCVRQGQDALCCALSSPCSLCPISWQGGDWGTAKETLSFKYFLQRLLSAQRTNSSRSSPIPSSVHAGSEPGRAGGAAGGREQLPGTMLWPLHFAFSLFLFSYPSNGESIHPPPQAGQQLMSVCKTLPAP